MQDKKQKKIAKKTDKKFDTIEDINNFLKFNKTFRTISKPLKAVKVELSKMSFKKIQKLTKPIKGNLFDDINSERQERLI